MKRTMKRVWKSVGYLLTMWVIGGLLYGGIEVVWRGWSCRSMVVVGGLCFLVMGALNHMDNRFFGWRTPLLLQCLIAAGCVTAVEFVSGCVLNLWWGWGIWDYSHMWGNLLGQICPLYAALWVPLSLVGILLADWLGWRLWDGRQPQYVITWRRTWKPFAYNT